MNKMPKSSLTKSQQQFIFFFNYKALRIMYKKCKNFAVLGLGLPVSKM
jgi:hypothetical protein